MVDEIEVAEAEQVGVVAALLAHDRVAAIAGQAVYAPGQAFNDSYPRVTIWPPEVLDRGTGCADGFELIFTVHSWARGDRAWLIASRLAGAVRAALEGEIVIEGYRLLTAERRFRGSRPVGDPDPTIAHVVSTFRLLVNPAAPAA